MCVPLRTGSPSIFCYDGGRVARAFDSNLGYPGSCQSAWVRIHPFFIQAARTFLTVIISSPGMISPCIPVIHISRLYDFSYPCPVSTFLHVLFIIKKKRNVDVPQNINQFASKTDKRPSPWAANNSFFFLEPFDCYNRVLQNIYKC